MSKKRKAFYGPPNWIVTRYSVEDRRMFGFWTLVIAAIGTVFLWLFDASSSLWFLWLSTLSVAALVPNFSAETPVEQEGGENT